MNICFVIHTDFIESSYGGIETYLKNLSLELVKNGHEVHIICCTGKKITDYVYKGIHIHRVCSGVVFFHPLLLKIFPPSRIIDKYFYHTTVNLTIGWRIYRKFKKLHKRKPFDVVECDDTAGLGVFFPLCSRVRFITRMHTSWTMVALLNKEQVTLDKKIVYFLERLQIKKSDALNADSFSLKKRSSNFFNIDPSRIDVTYYGIDISKYESISKKRITKQDYILYFGRLEERKGMRLLARALPKVFSKHPNLKMVFVGNHHVETKHSRLIKHFDAKRHIRGKNKPFAKNIMFIKHLPHKNLNPIIKNAKLVVLPSTWEAFGFTCLESMALGKPVLATSGSGFEEQILEDEKYGFLVKPNNAKALANKILICLKRKDLDIVGKRAKNRAKFFSNEKITKEMIDYYKKVSMKT
ncbi:hypothetical protein CEE44_03155 [Candidatus Woesearchaeota archaeon B3_Woes]|nr:MAG: hypothetical protein CEE44_03155 [Candidatus Woesearchaeota archaeon B3_Woes]